MALTAPLPSLAAGREGRSQPRFYRGTGGNYILDKQAIIIDFGRSTTKVGFASESRPQRIFPSPELGPRKRLGDHVTTTLSYPEWVDVLDKFLARIFFTHLSVNPKDRRVVVCEAVLSPTVFRKALVFVLLKRLSAVSVSFAIDLVLPLYLTGLSSGIVLDLGYESSRVLPTFASVPILSAFAVSRAGGRRMNDLVRAALQVRPPPQAAPDANPTAASLGEGALEDIKARACYVTFTYKPEDSEEVRLFTEEDAHINLGDLGAVTVPSEIRWKATEVLFDESLFEQLMQREASEAPSQSASASTAAATARARGDAAVADAAAARKEDIEAFGTLPEAFLHAVRSCPIDVRPKVLQNVVVCGGCASLRGLLPRLALELKATLERCPDTSALVPKLRFTPLDFPPIYAVWAGAALYGSLEGILEHTLEDYDSGKLIADWAREGFA